jgi:catechol 2,3-dioxygenase-like lactoylglutathione lyase family enzyme
MTGEKKTIMATTTHVTYKHGFSGFAVPDIEAAGTFYREVLGLDAGDGGMGSLRLTLPGGTDVFVYPKDDHTPAGFTILNLEVDDIERVVDALAERGVEFLRYDGFGQDDRGIAGGGEYGPRIAWFTDPAGNIFSVLQNES